MCMKTMGWFLTIHTSWWATKYKGCIVVPKRWRHCHSVFLAGSSLWGDILQRNRILSIVMAVCGQSHIASQPRCKSKAAKMTLHWSLGGVFQGRPLPASDSVRLLTRCNPQTAVVDLPSSGWVGQKVSSEKELVMAAPSTPTSSGFACETEMPSIPLQVRIYFALRPPLWGDQQATYLPV